VVSREALRPGIARGPYPERVPEREDFLERAAHGLRGALLHHRSLENEARRFVDAVRRNAPGSVSDPELSHLVTEVRDGLQCRGLTEELVPRAFALVCETACQLMAGWAMVRGMLAEMQTGEGKTLAVSLPAATAALAGIPVHLISANDYLVERDAETMRPLYESLGLSVAAVTDRLRDPAARSAAYACDVTYATSSSIAFDYLRDGLQRRGRRGRLTLRMSGAEGEAPLSERLLLRGLCFAIVDEADSVLIDEARTPLILSGQSERPGQEDSSEMYRHAVELARALNEGSDFQLNRAQGRVEVTPSGLEKLESLARPLGGIFAGPQRREELVSGALAALHLFDRERHYIVRDDKVEIVDQSTGRAMPDRSWERGLHQMIEVKEGVPLTAETETQARISYQQFFRRYLRVAGATGTAQEVSRELWQVYRLRTFVVPTRRPVQRRDAGTRVFATQQEKWSAVVESVRAAREREQPVLVGTCSVAASEHLSRLLQEQKIAHRVLNARQDEHEAAIVAEAGEPGRITVATNMAGRGTDISLAEGAAERGGLHVIATQKGDARRIDRQLYGRSGRQGDPGSFEAILSLEDDPVRDRVPGAILGFLAARDDTSQLWKALTSIAQRAEEYRHARMRRSLMASEESLEDLLAFSGVGE
jgi:preprotein translocase subunit SecA